MCAHILAHSSINELLSSFHVLAIVNDTIDTGCMYLSELVFSLSLGKCPVVELLDHMVFLLLIFLRNRHIIFHNSCINLFPPMMHKSYFLSMSLTTLVIPYLSDTSHSDWYKVLLSHCGFNFTFL